MGSASNSTEQIWDQFGDKLRGYLLKRVADRQVAEDLFQETFIRIHKRLETLDNEQRIAGWVFQIARNLVIDHYRSQGRSPATVAINESEPSLEDVEDNLNELVMGWMPTVAMMLPEPYREAVELYELQGMSQQAIADHLGLSLSGTKS